MVYAIIKSVAVNICIPMWFLISMYMGYISNSKLGGSMVICTFKVHKYDSLSWKVISAHSLKQCVECSFPKSHQQWISSDLGFASLVG